MRKFSLLLAIVLGVIFGGLVVSFTGFPPAAHAQSSAPDTFATYTGSTPSSATVYTASSTSTRPRIKALSVGSSSSTLVQIQDNATVILNIPVLANQPYFLGPDFFTGPGSNGLAITAGHSIKVTAAAGTVGLALRLEDN